MKPKSKIVLTGAVASAIAMGAVTGVILPTTKAQAIEAGVNASGSVNAGTSTTTTTNNDASGGILASSDTSADADADGGTTTNASSDEPSNLNAQAGADTDARMREATSRQSGSRGSLIDDTTDASANADINTGINTQLDATADAEADAAAAADTDARMREAESRMSGSRGSLTSDTTAGADQNAELRSQIRNDPSAEIDLGVGVSADTDAEADTGTRRSGGLLGLFRGDADADAGAETQIGASGKLQ